MAEANIRALTGNMPSNIEISKLGNPIEAEYTICLVLNFSKSIELSRPISDRRLEVLVRSLDFAIRVDERAARRPGGQLAAWRPAQARSGAAHGA